MKSRLTIFAFVAALFACFSARAAGSSDFSGEYADKKFMNGQAIFQLSLEQSGKEVSVFFNGVRHDGQGVAVEGDARGKITGKGTVEFKFEDGMKNSGLGTITKAGEDVILSMKVTHVADPRALPFYQQNLRLNRVKK